MKRLFRLGASMSRVDKGDRHHHSWFIVDTLRTPLTMRLIAESIERFAQKQKSDLAEILTDRHHRSDSDIRKKVLQGFNELGQRAGRTKLTEFNACHAPRISVI